MKYAPGERVQVFTILTFVPCDSGTIKEDADDNIYLVTTDNESIGIYVHADYLRPDYRDQSRKDGKAA